MTPELEAEPQAIYAPSQPMGPGPTQPPPTPAMALDLQATITQLLTVVGVMKQAPTTVPAPGPAMCEAPEVEKLKF